MQQLLTVPAAYQHAVHGEETKVLMPNCSAVLVSSLAVQHLILC